MAEFLPLCDVLFNVISLTGYFCDVLFDVILSYALFERGCFVYSSIVIGLVLMSSIISQIVSLRWYLHKQRSQDGVHSETSVYSIDKKKPIASPVDDQIDEELFGKNSKPNAKKYCVIALHCSQLGVLWRYAKLFVPVDLRFVKHEVRDLCMLRLLHAFCEAAPMLLLQLYILVMLQKEELALVKPDVPLKTLGSSNAVTPVIVQETILNQQHQLRTFKDLNVVSSVLSLFSVCWALASFSKNVRIQNVHRLVLTWLGVIFQFLWRLGTVISRVAALTMYASVYNQWIFLVIILHWLSMFLWLISPKNVFHGERMSSLRKISLAGVIAFVYIFAYINLQEVNHRQKMITFYVVMFLENSLLVFLWIIGTWSERPDNWFLIPLMILSSFIAGIAFMLLYYRYFHVRRLSYVAGGRLPNDNQLMYSSAEGVSMDKNLNICQPKYPAQIPGVFNCRFSNPVGNGAARRKKKKPTTFVPPPNLSITQTAANGGNISCTTSITGLMSIPFWRRPVSQSQTGGSENEGSASSRVNIHQKLQEKKQKQLAELKIIEEEIKQGKLGGPNSSNNLRLNADDQTILPRQPIPCVKKHINIDPQEWRTSSPDPSIMFNDLNAISPSNINGIDKFSRAYIDDRDDSVLGVDPNGYRIPSDIDSQMSLPRSYTLPREFKYYRRNKLRKLIKNEHFINSTNSSDGDVDSCDDNEPTRNCSQRRIIRVQAPVPTSNARIHQNQFRRDDIIKINSPLTVQNAFIQRNIGTMSASPSPLIFSQTNFNNLNIHGNSIDRNTMRSASSGSSNNNQANLSHDQHLMGNDYFNGSFDLINGIENSNASFSGGPSRFTRSRAYGNSTNVRHETKL